MVVGIAVVVVCVAVIVRLVRGYLDDTVRDVIDEYIDEGVFAYRERECPRAVAPGACVHPTAKTRPGGDQP